MNCLMCDKDVAPVIGFEDVFGIPYHITIDCKNCLSYFFKILLNRRGEIHYAYSAFEFSGYCVLYNFSDIDILTEIVFDDTSLIKKKSIVPINELTLKKIKTLMMLT